MIGTVINVAAVVLGTALGLLLKGRIPSRTSQGIVQAIGLFTMLIGLRMAWGTHDPFMLLIGLASGTVVGSLIDIESRLESMGAQLKSRYAEGESLFTQGFVTASLLFGVGPMAIMGSLQDGLTGDYTILTTKSLMDGISSIPLAASLGMGVGFSAIPILVYQGGISLGAGLLKAVMTEPVVREMTAVGGVLILGIGFNLLLNARVKVGNMLPALLTAAILAAIRA